MYIDKFLRIATRSILAACILVILSSSKAQGQTALTTADACDAQAQSCDVRSLTAMVRELKQQVESLNAQVAEMRAEQQGGKAAAEASAGTSRALQTPTPSNQSGYSSSQLYGASTAAPSLPSTALPGENPQPQTLEQRISQLEENQQLAAANLAEQNQTKVESGSKYRVRLSGIILLNLFDNVGQVDNTDFPEIATPADGFDSSSAFGGSLRQTQIRVDAFGPDIAGARTSANVTFDFAGGFPDAPNGATMGFVRLRTGTMRLDWSNTSLIAGQDYLFFAPLEPTSMASLALPPLSYAGNLWSWTPQVRIEHRVKIGGDSSLLLEGGILDSLSGDLPYSEYENYPSWGEESGQPAYAGRVAWQHTVFGQDLILGTGGYFGRQYWGFGRSINGWASTIDATVPLGQRLEFTAEFFRGKALGGLGGGIGQDALFTTAFTDPTSAVAGLDSIGGWAQMKWKLRPNFEINGAWGLDNPFASELRKYPLSQSYYGPLLSKNWSPFVNFIYHPRSDVVFSLEYRYLQTTVFNATTPSAHHVNASLGYLF